MLTFEQIKEILQSKWYLGHIIRYRNNKCSLCQQIIPTKLYYYKYDYDSFGITSSCESCISKFERSYLMADGRYKLYELDEKELFTVNILCSPCR